MNNTEPSVHYMFLKKNSDQSSNPIAIVGTQVSRTYWPTTHDRRIRRNTDINVEYIMYPHWHSRIRYTCNPYFAGSFFEYRLCVKILKYNELNLKHYTDTTMADQAQVGVPPVTIEMGEPLGEGALADTLKPLWKLVSKNWS